jgi:poly-gamma-glutamate capsule biosynthesis protein CapA/YwtB (metallophosphatase superfamily)
MSLNRAVLPVIAVLLAFSAHADERRLAGRLVSDSGEPLQRAIVEVNGLTAEVAADGAFTVVADPADLYQFRFYANGHYPMVQTFSELEMGWLKEGDSGNSRVPDVSLVKRAAGRVMLAFGGDTMMGRRFITPDAGEPVLVRDGDRAEDARALLSHIEPWLQLAEYTSVNLETQVMSGAPPGKAPKSYVFFSPPELLHALKQAGVDYVTLGNNHTFDYLAAGLETTIQALDASGLDWSGAGLNEPLSLESHRTEIGGQRMSYLGYVGWAGNFSPNQVAQGDDKGGAALGSARNIGLTVSRDVAAGYRPVVQYHGSREYTDEPTLVTESRLKESIDQGAVVAIAHHPHITQGFEIYKDRLIAYSMGNFMFDQFHYATTRSYLLYVWLDGDRLHRAEIVPIHLKGYVPVPATDSVRQTILRRARDLSARRGIFLQASGGHAVILPDRPREEPVTALALASDTAPLGPGESVSDLHRASWTKSIESIKLPSARSDRVRLGMDLLPNGHLESHYLFATPDRAWIEDGSQSVVEVAAAPSGRRAMRLNIPAGREAGTVGMRTFEYTFEPGTPTSFVTWAAADRPATVSAFQQWRKRDQDRAEALAEGQLRFIGSLELLPGSWRELRFDFDSPRVTAISYRVVLQVHPADPQTELTAWFDDLSLIEWLSPPLAPGPVPAHVPVRQASHVGLATESP